MATAVSLGWGQSQEGPCVASERWEPVLSSWAQGGVGGGRRPEGARVRTTRPVGVERRGQALHCFPLPTPEQEARTGHHPGKLL